MGRNIDQIWINTFFFSKRLANESIRRKEARIQKEIKEKELEEARALLAKAEKWKGKKGKKAIGNGVSSFSNWLSFLWMLMIAGLWHVCHLFLLFSPPHHVCISLFLRPLRVNKTGWMDDRTNG
jgi:hypothetical protein